MKKEIKGFLVDMAWVLMTLALLAFVLFDFIWPILKTAAVIKYIFGV